MRPFAALPLLALAGCSVCQPTRFAWPVFGEAVARSRLRVDARKWVASKLLPKKYGDKVQAELSGPEGGPVEFVIRDMTAKGEKP